MKNCVEYIIQISIIIILLSQVIIYFLINDIEYRIRICFSAKYYFNVKYFNTNINKKICI